MIKSILLLFLFLTPYAFCQDNSSEIQAMNKYKVVFSGGYETDPRIMEDPLCS